MNSSTNYEMCVHPKGSAHETKVIRTWIPILINGYKEMNKLSINNELAMVASIVLKCSSWVWVSLEFPILDLVSGWSLIESFTSFYLTKNNLSLCRSEQLSSDSSLEEQSSVLESPSSTFRLFLTLISYFVEGWTEIGLVQDLVSSGDLILDSGLINYALVA